MVAGTPFIKQGMVSVARVAEQLGQNCARRVEPLMGLGKVAHLHIVTKLDRAVQRG